MDDRALLEAIRTIVREETTQIVDARLDDKLESVNSRLDAMQTDLQDIKQRVTRVEIIQENTITKRIDSIWEVVGGVQERFEKLDHLEAKVEDHGHRIFALEQVVSAK